VVLLVFGLVFSLELQLKGKWAATYFGELVDLLVQQLDLLLVLALVNTSEFELVCGWATMSADGLDDLLVHQLDKR